MIDPTRKQWLAAQARLERLEHDWQKANPGQTVDGPPVEDAVEAILGPCPPESWRSGGIGTLAVTPHAHGGVPEPEQAQTFGRRAA
jgi:hypothetical protein